MKLLYMEVLLMSKIPPGPKSVRVTAKVGSFGLFSLAGHKSLRVTANVCSFLNMSTKLPWMEVLTTVKL